MKLLSIDLRLLVVFDTLMKEKSVTQTANMLSMTQPGVSNALARLRDIFGDALFIRKPGGMRPTPRALELAVPVGEALRRLESAIEPANFVPAQSHRTFRLAMTPHSSTLVLPPLMALIEKEAPDIRLSVVPRSSVLAVSMLDENEVDFVLGVAHTLPSRFSKLILFQDQFVCVMRKDHPLTTGPLTLDRFAQAKHCAITAAGERNILFEVLLREAGYQIENMIVLNEYLAGALSLANTQMVTGMLSRIFIILSKLQNSPLIARTLPLPKVDVSLTWHPGLSNHPAHDWLRSKIVEVSRALPPLADVPEEMLAPGSDRG